MGPILVPTSSLATWPFTPSWDGGPPSWRLFPGLSDTSLMPDPPCFSETFSFMLTGEDGSRRFGYCRRLLVSGPIQSSGAGPQCVHAWASAPASAVACVTSYVLLPACSLRLPQCTHVCVHTQTRHSWDGRTPSGPSDLAPRI